MQKDIACRGWIGTRNLLNTRSTLSYQLSCTVRRILRLEIINYILNVINILVYINSASINSSSASVMLSCVIVHSVI